MRVGRVKRPGPPPEAGWSTTELTGEEKDCGPCGFDRVKRPDPSLTAGGSTTELTEEEKDCGFDRVKRPDPSLTAGGSTTELTESAGSGRGTDDDASWLGTSTETSQLAAIGSISSKRIGIVPEAKDNRGILPKQTVAPLANKKSLPKIMSAPQRLTTTTTRTDVIRKINSTRLLVQLLTRASVAISDN